MCIARCDTESRGSIHVQFLDGTVTVYFTTLFPNEFHRTTTIFICQLFLYNENLYLIEFSQTFIDHWNVN
ncbi:unnamed protein product [Schistosoma intercalatum]|nr:unnamed protein product [Schistosoma intercalatum]CAH8441888.1 unnamed protein product [Schistosoma intercalatum]